VGNAIVKESRIFKTLKPDVAEELTREAANLLANMDVLSIEGAEDAVTRNAIQSALSYYDAAYIHTAVTLGLTLATEDKRLARAAKDVNVQTTSLSELS
jgi:predicted nucleic acid-binding protein